MNRPIVNINLVLLLFILPALGTGVHAEQKPEQIVLTWQGDTKTSMTITWRTDEPNALTYGMMKIDEAAKKYGEGLRFTDVRTKLIEEGWEGAGYDSPKEAFLALAVGVKNYSNRDSRFAYQFLLNNWDHYTENVGFEKELLPDRNEWNRVYGGVSHNRLYYTEGDDLLTHEHSTPANGVSTAEAETYTFAETTAWLHTVELTELKPGTTYSGLIKSDNSNAEPFTFRTAPAERKAFSFIAGADTQSETTERKEMTSHAATLDPEFILISGDLVMRGMAENEWDSWFNEWHDLMITDEGRRVPVLPALGNHDVRGWIMGDFETDAAFYANRFNLPYPHRYYSLEYGDGFVLLTLDSGHTSAFNEDLNWFEDTGYYEGGPHKVRSSHDGAQKQWLETTLQNYSDRPWIIAHYHINAFATSQHYWEKPRYGRPLMHEHWIPLFEKYGVDLVHEGHGHRMKRTHPVKNGEIHEDGVTYIGDGGWGTHMGIPDDMWFVADKGSDHHFWKITLDEGWNQLTGRPVKWIESNAVDGQKFTITNRMYQPN